MLNHVENHDSERLRRRDNANLFVSYPRANSTSLLSPAVSSLSFFFFHLFPPSYPATLGSFLFSLLSSLQSLSRRASRARGIIVDPVSEVVKTWRPRGLSSLRYRRRLNILYPTMSAARVIDSPAHGESGRTDRELTRKRRVESSRNDDDGPSAADGRSWTTLIRDADASAQSSRHE